MSEPDKTIPQQLEKVGVQQIEPLKPPIVDPKQEGQWPQRIKLLEGVQYGVMVVVFIAFIGFLFTVFQMMWSAEAAKQASYQSLIEIVNQQSEKIDLLTQQLQDYGKNTQTTIPKHP